MAADGADVVVVAGGGDGDVGRTGCADVSYSAGKVACIK